jgi:hypothetical protein
MITGNLLIFLLTSCGGGLKTSRNEFLGEIPSIQKYYSVKVDEKKKELKACTDINKAFKLDKEEQLLEQEWETKISECMKANSLTTGLPFEPLKDQLCPVSKISVSLVNKHGFQIKIAIKFDKDIKFDGKDLCIYYVAVGKDGKEIPGTELQSWINQGLMKDIKAGTEVETTGCWTISALSNMEDFAKIKFITKNEYNKM